MYISKISAQNFAGNIKITTAPDYRLKTIDAKKLEDVRPTTTNDNGTYMGCAFELGDKTYRTDNDITFWDYNQIIRKAAKGNGTITLPGTFTVIEQPVIDD